MTLKTQSLSPNNGLAKQKKYVKFGTKNSFQPSPKILAPCHGFEKLALLGLLCHSCGLSRALFDQNNPDIHTQNIENK